MAKEMLINTVAGQECRIAIVQDGKLEELYVERASSASHVGNIYKGRIVNVEPSIQAAFIDFGVSKHGFLHISDVQPQYFPDGNKLPENVGRKHPHFRRPPIQECFKRGQEIVVQMTKEGIGTKGPTMTTYLSLPGRLVVMMPGMAKLGISRKIEDEEARTQARLTIKELKLPGDMGFIVRTAGVGRSTRDLQRDLNYLMRLWKTIKKHIASVKAPAEIYQESDLVIRTTRDIYSKDIQRIICDDDTTALRVREFLNVAMPRTKHRIDFYTGKEGLFHDYGLEEEIESVYARRVEMDSGGSLVIDQTEALVAIDVNTGRFRQHTDAETTAFKMNQAAAKEITRQLRLRDLGGVIVIDFIDMREEKNRRAVEKTLRDAMKVDRAKTRVLHINSFGIVEMTRQRVGPSLRDNIYRTCSHCSGAGLIKSQESQALLAMRSLQRATSNADVVRVEMTVTPEVAHHLANHQRKQISDLEVATDRSIVVRADPDLSGDQMHIKCTNSRGSEVAWEHKLTGPAERQVHTVSLEEFLQQSAKREDNGTKISAPEPPQAKEAEVAPKPKAKRRGRRGGRKHKKANGEATVSEQPAAEETKPEPSPEAAKAEAPEAVKADAPELSADVAPRPKAKRRGRRGGRKHKKPAAEETKTEATAPEQPAAEETKPEPSAKADAPEPSAESASKPKAKRRGRRGGRKHKKPAAEETKTEATAPEQPAEQ